MLTSIRSLRAHCQGSRIPAEQITGANATRSRTIAPSPPSPRPFMPLLLILRRNTEWVDYHWCSLRERRRRLTITLVLLTLRSSCCFFYTLFSSITVQRNISLKKKSKDYDTTRWTEIKGPEDTPRRFDSLYSWHLTFRRAYVVSHRRVEQSLNVWRRTTAESGIAERDIGGGFRALARGDEGSNYIVYKKKKRLKRRIHQRRPPAIRAMITLRSRRLRKKKRNR